ncbi:MAG: hypothetical protein RRB13_14240 [bacterium]|nr:hypothetical protein [bacterium]
MQSHYFMLTYDFDPAHRTEENFRFMDEGLKNEDWLPLGPRHSFTLEVEADNPTKAHRIAVHSVEHAYKDHGAQGVLSVALQFGPEPLVELELREVAGG